MLKPKITHWFHAKTRACILFVSCYFLSFRFGAGGVPCSMAFSLRYAHGRDGIVVIGLIDRVTLVLLLLCSSLFKMHA